jgi:hypothetical protein
MMYILNWRDWNTACKLYGHAALAVNKISGRPKWPDSDPTTATANTIPAPAGTTPTAPPQPTKWAGRSDPATTSTTSTVSKPTTVTPTSPSSRHPHMPKFTTNKFKTKIAAGVNSAAGDDFQEIKHE